MPQDSQESNPVKAKFWSLFSDPKESPRPLVIEVPVASRPEPPNPDVRLAIISLQHNIGFQYLMKKFQFQKAVLDARLRSTKHKSLEEVQILQAGIAASDWLKAEVDFETKQQAPEQKKVSSYEQQLFDEINRNINVLE
jgi:hypothetical protein